MTVPLPRYSLGEEIANVVTHGVGIALAIAGLVVLAVVAARDGTAVHVAASAIFGVALVLCFTTSTLYHTVQPERVRRVLRALDHSAIFVLIAGTWTPLALTLPSHSARVMLTVAWTGAALGVARALFWIHAPKWLVAVLAVAMGWLAILYLPGIGAAAGANVVVWVLLGGAFYSAGALIYALKRPNPWPKVFGYHEVFHSLVVAAAIAHFVGVVIALKSMS